MIILKRTLRTLHSRDVSWCGPVAAVWQSTFAVGTRRKSQVLIANAWHHRTDAVSSVVALLAILGSMCGAPMLDPIAGLMVAGMVSLTGVQVRVLPLTGVPRSLFPRGWRARSFLRPVR